MLAWLVPELWALEHQMLGPGGLETAGLAGWELARMLAWLVAQLWAVLKDCRHRIPAVLAGWRLQGLRGICWPRKLTA